MTMSASNEIPENWREIELPPEGIVRVEEDTDENGLYLEYAGVSRVQLFKQVDAALVAVGYHKYGEAFDGNVIGYARGTSQLAVKIDELGALYLAIFNENGKEPLLHGVVFGRCTLGQPVSGDQAKEALLNELTDEE